MQKVHYKIINGSIKAMTYKIFDKMLVIWTAATVIYRDKTL